MVSLIEYHRIGMQDLFHYLPQFIFSGFDQNVEMISHQANRVEGTRKSIHCVLQVLQESYVVIWFLEDWHPAVAPTHDMIHSSRIPNSRSSSHIFTAK